MSAVSEQTGPPNPIAALAAYLLSYWKFLDAGRAQSTVAPLEPLVLLWSVSNGT